MAQVGTKPNQPVSSGLKQTNNSILDYKAILESNVRHIKLKADPYAHTYVYGLDGMDDLYP